MGVYIQLKDKLQKLSSVETWGELKDKPNILDDSSDTFYIADSQGNVIAKVDADGIHTTNLKLDGGITDNSSDYFAISDKNGNIIARIDKDGIRTTDIRLNGLETDEQTVVTAINQVWDDVVKLYEADRNQKSLITDNSDAIGALETRLENINDDESGEYCIVDQNGNIIAKIDQDGIKTTNVTLSTLNDVSIDQYVLWSNIPDYDAELFVIRGSISEDDGETVTIDKTHIEIEEASGKTKILRLTDADDNVYIYYFGRQNDIDAFEFYRLDGYTLYKITITSSDSIYRYSYSFAPSSLQETVNDHIDDTTSHITSEERTAWNNKSDLPNIQDDESGEFNFVDPNGNVIAKVDANGIHTTNVTLGTLNNVPIEQYAKLENIPENELVIVTGSWASSTLTLEANAHATIQNAIDDDKIVVLDVTGIGRCYYNSYSAGTYYFRNVSIFGGYSIAVTASTATVTYANTLTSITKTGTGPIVSLDTSGNTIYAIHRVMTVDDLPSEFIELQETVNATATSADSKATQNASDIADLQTSLSDYAKTEDLTPYQTKEDNGLETDAKTIVGGINEVKSAASSLEGEMRQARYDIDNIAGRVGDIVSGDEVVAKATNAEQLGGVPASDYAKKSFADGIAQDLGDLDHTVYVQGVELKSNIDTLEKKVQNINDDESGEYYLVDQNGNIIFKVDKDGIHTTDIYLNGARVTTDNASLVATESSDGLMSAADKTIMNRFTYDYDIPKLTMDGGASQVICNDDAVEIFAAGGLYHDGKEIAVKEDIPAGTNWLHEKYEGTVMRFSKSEESDDYVEIDYDEETVTVAAYNDVNITSEEGYINMKAPSVRVHGKEVATQEYVDNSLPLALLAPVVRSTLYDNGESDSTEYGLQLDFDNPNPFEVTYHIWFKNETHATENPSSSDSYYWRTGTLQANARGATAIFSHYQFSMFDLYNAKVYFTHQSGFRSSIVNISVRG